MKPLLIEFLNTLHNMIVEKSRQLWAALVEVALDTLNRCLCSIVISSFNRVEELRRLVRETLHNLLELKFEKSFAQSLTDFDLFTRL